MLALMENPMRALWVSGALTLLMWAQGALAGTVLVVGDSISAALGVDTRQGWVALLQKRLQDGGFEHRVVNASISGDTSSGGAARLPALLEQHQPELVIIELGGNDGLRGQPLVQLQQNLARMIDASRAAEAEVLLLGMRLPPNYGQRYTQAFAKVMRTWPRASRWPWCRSARGGWWCPGDDAGRRHPPNGSGSADHAGERLADAGAAALSLPRLQAFGYRGAPALEP